LTQDHEFGGIDILHREVIGMLDVEVESVRALYCEHEDAGCHNQAENAADNRMHVGAVPQLKIAVQEGHYGTPFRQEHQSQQNDDDDSDGDDKTSHVGCPAPSDYDATMGLPMNADQCQ
jgi:hypothetical protein